MLAVLPLDLTIPASKLILWVSTAAAAGLLIALALKGLQLMWKGFTSIFPKRMGKFNAGLSAGWAQVRADLRSGGRDARHARKWRAHYRRQRIARDARAWREHRAEMKRLKGWTPAKANSDKSIPF